MTRTWRNAPKLNKERPWGYSARCANCDGPRLPDGRCVVSGHLSGWCESDSSRFEDGERWGWTSMPWGNSYAQERVREARRAYREAAKESNP